MIRAPRGVSMIDLQQKVNESLAGSLARASRKIRVGQRVRIIKHFGGVEIWLKVDARKNNGTAWVTR